MNAGETFLAKELVNDTVPKKINELRFGVL